MMPVPDIPPFEELDWNELTTRIKTGDPAAMERLYSFFSAKVRFHLRRQLRDQELDDKMHDTFLVVVQAIRRGELREPERLVGYIKTVVRRTVSRHLDRQYRARGSEQDAEEGIQLVDRRHTPEESIISEEKVRIMEQVLSDVSERDREILTRFYLKGQSREQICQEMKLTETQFRLLKSRAKARFGELGRQKLL